MGFTYAIEFLLSKYTLPTCLTFVGLILGGIPILVKHFKAGLDEKQGGKISAANVIAFVLLFALVIFMAFQQGADNELTTFDVNAGNMIKLFFALSLIHISSCPPYRRCGRHGVPGAWHGF